MQPNLLLRSNATGRSLVGGEGRGGRGSHQDKGYSLKQPPVNTAAKHYVSDDKGCGSLALVTCMLTVSALDKVQLPVVARAAQQLCARKIDLRRAFGVTPQEGSKQH